MAEIREDVVFDFADAIREINRVERLFDEAFGGPIPIDLDTQRAIREARTELERLQGIELPIDIPVEEIRRDFDRLEDSISIDDPLAEARLEAERLGDSLRDADQSADRLHTTTRQLDDELDRAATEARRLDDELDDAGRRGTAGIGGLTGQIGRMTAGFVAGIAVVRGFGEAFRFVSSSFRAASDAEESINKLNVVFGEFSEEVQDFTRDAPVSLGLARREADAFAGTFGNLFVSMGLTQEAAAGMSTDVVQLGADLASFNNLTVDESLIKLRAGLVGEFEALRSLGVALNANLVEQKAFELGMVDVNGEVTEAGKIQARYALILENTATAQGDFARTADGIANTQRTLRGQFEDLREEVGQALLPVLAQLLESGPAIIGVFEDMLPTIALLGQQFANLAQSMGGVSDQEGLFDFIVDIPRGFGAVTDTVTGLSGALITLLNPTEQFHEKWGEVQDRLAQTTGNIAIRVIEDDIIGGLRKGVGAADAFAQSLIRLDEKMVLNVDTLERFAAITGASVEEQFAAIGLVRRRAEEFGIEAEALEVLNQRYLELAAAQGIQRGGAGRGAEGAAERRRAILEAQERAARRAALAEQGLGESMAIVLEAALAAGIPVEEFVTQTENIPQGVADAISILGDFELALLAVDERIAAMELEGLTGAMDAAAEALRDTEGEIIEDFTTFLDELETELAARDAFESNLALLRAMGLDNLAEVFDQAGLDAAAALADAVANPAEAQRAEQALDGQGQNQGAIYVAGIVSAIDDGSLEVNQALIENLLSAAESADTPEVKQALIDLADRLSLRVPVEFDVGSITVPSDLIGGRPVRGGSPGPVGGGGTTVVNNTFNTQPQPTVDSQRITTSTRRIGNVS